MSAPQLPIVFVGCSSESLHIAKTIQTNFADMAHVELWTQGTFKPSHDYLTDLLRQSRSVDFAVFVLSPDDVTKSRNIEEASPRDNIIFEAGLFMGSLGRDRVFLLAPKGLAQKKPTDLSGITMLMYATPPEGASWRAALGAATNQIEDAIKDMGRIKNVLVTKPNWIEITEGNVPFIEVCGTATEIFMTSVMLTRTLTSQRAFLANKLQSATSIRAVLPDIEVSFEEYDEDGALSRRDYKRKLGEIRSSLDVMLELMDIGDFQLRFARFQPVATVFMANPSKPSGRIFYMPLLFGSYNHPRIATILDGEVHTEWFENLRKRYYEDLWAIAKRATKNTITQTVRRIDDRIRKGHV